MARAAIHSNRRENLYEISHFLKACLQVNASVRLEKITLLENAFHTPC